MPNYPIPYQQNWGYSGNVGQQLYPNYQNPPVQQQVPAQQQQSGIGLKWVDGEVGAKAWQMPSGWPANTPIALWDTNDTVIYIKSINPMGMPNPLQKARYKLETVHSGEAQHAFSGDMDRKDEYVRKEDMEKMKQDLMDAIGSITPGTVKRTAKGEA